MLILLETVLGLGFMSLITKLKSQNITKYGYLKEIIICLGRYSVSTSQ